MNFNIARQPLVPSFLTLAALAVIAMWNVGSAPVLLPEAVTIPSDGFLAIATPEELLLRFQNACPGWSRWIGGLLMLFTGTSLGRLTVRYNLYNAGTCLAIPLFGAIATGLISNGNYLPILTATTLLALAVKNYCRSFRSGYSFDALFRASLYLGILPLVAPAALPLVLLLPLAVLLFRRTLREAVVALAGLLLPILTFCYVNWGAGGEFLAPFPPACRAFTEGSPLCAAFAIPLTHLILLGVILLLDLLALFYFLADIYAAGTKPRAILIFQICLLGLCIPTLINPAATPAIILLAAVPSCVLLPFLLVRIHRIPASLLYLLLLAVAITAAVLQ